MRFLVKIFNGFLLFCAITCVLFGCSESSIRLNPAQGAVSPGLTAEPWTDADSLFRRDQKWLGGDGASSVLLGDDRVLWLFGDSLIADEMSAGRNGCVMIRNSIAVQRGSNPEGATINFFYRFRDKQPSSFFPEKNNIWFWPGQGIRIKDTLLVFLMKIRSSTNEIGFETAGWGAVMILNPHEAPINWTLNWITTPENNYGIIVGSGSILHDHHFVYAFSSDDSKAHDIFIARWPADDIVRGDLNEPEWWTGNERGWMKQPDLAGKPTPVFSEGQVEFTVHFEPRIGKYLEIQTIGFGASDIAFRMAENLTGPWSDLKRFYRPEEYFVKNVVIYAGKAHPELDGADMILTYVANSTDFNQLVRDSRLYYPRFLKVRVGG